MIKDRKGFVITIDLTIAVLVVFTIVVFSTYKVSQASYDTSGKVLMNKVGNDILSVLHNKDVLASLNKNSIESKMNDLVPVNYDMQIKVECSNKTIETSLEPPTDRFIGSGTRIISSDNLDYCTTRYWVWLK